MHKICIIYPLNFCESLQSYQTILLLKIKKQGSRKRQFIQIEIAISTPANFIFMKKNLRGLTRFSNYLHTKRIIHEVTKESLLEKQKTSRQIYNFKMIRKPFDNLW